MCSKLLFKALVLIVSNASVEDGFIPNLVSNISIVKVKSMSNLKYNIFNPMIFFILLLLVMSIQDKSR